MLFQPAGLVKKKIIIKTLKHKCYSVYLKSVDRCCIYALSVEMNPGSSIPEVRVCTARSRVS